MLSGLDLRGVLNYVEQFNKENFLFVLEEACLEEAWLSGFLLDVDRLIGIGVSCVVCLNSEDAAVVAKVKSVLLESSVAFEFLEEGELLRSDWELAIKRGQIIVKKGLIEDRCKVENLFKKLIWIDEACPFDSVDEVYGERAVSLEQSILSNKEEHQLRLMQAKRWCVEGRVPRVHFLTMAEDHSLLEELFSAQGVGMMVYANPYEEVRPLARSEIVELLALMGPVISRQALLPRSYTEIEERLEDYFALVVDQHVLGCVALHYYEGAGVKVAEVACLFVKPSHQGQGYAKKLVLEAQRQAKLNGVNELIALTKTAGKLFFELGYVLESQSLLPGLIKGRGSLDKEFYLKRL